MKPYTPKSNSRAWSSIHEKNVDVIRVYKRTATIRVCMGGLRDGELQTFRGERLSSLSEPKRGGGPVMEPCKECDGTGEAPMACVVCNGDLTKEDMDANPEAEACISCVEEEEKYEAEHGDD